MEASPPGKLAEHSQPRSRDDIWVKAPRAPESKASAAPFTWIPMEESFRLGTGATKGCSAASPPVINPDFSLWTAESLVSVDALEVDGVTGSLGMAMAVGMMCAGRGMPLAKLLARVLSTLSEELL